MVFGLTAGLSASASGTAFAGDHPTEDTSSAVRSVSVSDYSQQQLGPRCRTSTSTDATGAEVTTVRCGREQYSTLEYEIPVPARSINPAASVAVEALDEGNSAQHEVLLYRPKANRVVVAISFAGRGRWTIAGTIDLSYDVPTTKDSRPCVTDGEWARVSVFDGGTGGNLQQVNDIFDTEGEQTVLSKDYDGFRFQVRSYKRCDSSRVRKVTFHQFNRGAWFSYWG
ncbi:hypothetical protein [Nocardioides flavescens]|uniref:Secreted protein n=1 Tax=Nocardioides flavescens TaxID=2691959 RepID=A0A6L7F4C8_9ACTN|nr:hypothetical protein [Nocardioides flavescens]MXG92044.1 hypothetical protein [Nocardioides flavescens]